MSETITKENKMSDSVDKRTALNRIEDMERVLVGLFQAVASHKQQLENVLGMQGDVVMVKDALRLLNKKTEAIVQLATPETGITVQAVSDLMVKMNVADLTGQVAAWVSSGHLTPADTVDTNSFLVCEEQNADGTLANPRIQFRLDSQDSSVTELLKGKKAGDVVTFGENKFNAKVLEIYSITEPKAPEAALATDSSTAATTTDAAPAASDTGDAGDVAAETATTTEATPAPVSTPPSAAPAGPSNEALAPPVENPVTQFVPSDPSTMVTASS